MYIDAHCHLEASSYGDELDDVIARALDAGVTHLVAVGASGVTAGAHEALALAERVPAVFATVGLHPHDAGKAGRAHVEEIARASQHERVVAVGEIGLDYHYDFAPPEAQNQVFRWMLELARDQDLPVMLHTREAHTDTLAALDEVGLPERGGVVHCFTGSWAQAQDYLERGLHLSIPGVVTFKNAADLRDAVERMPLERMLIESDSPYLAPVPHRGKRNEPAWVVDTAAAIGAERGLTGEDIGRIAARNTVALFDLPAQVEPALVYPIRNSLYVNITSRCTLACTFCPKVERRDWWVKGHWLRLRRDPAVDDLRAAIDAELARRPGIDEVVFVGLGEPTLRLDDLLTLARGLRARYGHRYRLRADTDGLGNHVHGRDITPDLASTLDAVCVSLNAPDPDTYARLCRSKLGRDAYGKVKEFIRAAAAAGLQVTASVVGVPGLDLESCRRVAEQELAVRFRHRIHQQYG
jgi:TatD DNase family protein